MTYIMTPSGAIIPMKEYQESYSDKHEEQD